MTEKLPVSSMTGFSSRSFTVGEATYMLNLRSVNHRFLDLKIRTPRSFNRFDHQIKTAIETKVKRGSVECFVERMQTPGSEVGTVRVSDVQAALAVKTLKELQAKFSLAGDVSLRDVISFPDVVEKGQQSDELSDADFKLFLIELNHGIDDFLKMRQLEGGKLTQVLLQIVADFREMNAELLTLRDTITERAKAKVKKKIEQCFDAYKTADEKMRALMETRIAQEMSYALEKLDIDEELTRFIGHVDQIDSLLTHGGPVGKKLDFLFQELNREANTLGNKAQDLGVSNQVIEIKMRIEQMREQSLNLE